MLFSKRWPYRRKARRLRIFFFRRLPMSNSISVLMQNKKDAAEVKFNTFECMKSIERTRI